MTGAAAPWLDSVLERYRRSPGRAMQQARPTPDQVPTETRTTVMLRRLAADSDATSVRHRLDELGFRERFDIVHVPRNNGSRLRSRLAFVNFLRPSSCQVGAGRSWSALLGVVSPSFVSSSRCVLEMDGGSPKGGLKVRSEGRSECPPGRAAQDSDCTRTEEDDVEGCALAPPSGSGPSRFSSLNAASAHLFSHRAEEVSDDRSCGGLIGL